MKSSICILATSLALAMASPIKMAGEKRVMETDWVFDYVTVTVTAGDKPTGGVFVEEPEHTPSPTPAPVHEVVETLTYAPAPSPTSAAESEPAPSTSSSSASSSSSISDAAILSSSSPVDMTDLLSPDYNTVMVNQHNLHRANHSAPDVEWDDTLASYAQDTASTCVFAHQMNVGSGGYGQNIASWGSTGDISGLTNVVAASAVTDQWYNSEALNYLWYHESSPPSGTDIDKWAHFSQLVWKSSTKLGCATVQCDAGTVLPFPSYFTVCNYGPEGNVGGEYADNVLEPNNDAYIYIDP